MAAVWGLAFALTRLAHQRCVAALDRFAAAAQHSIMSMSERIRQKLETGLAPSRLSIVDDSHRHAGHAGAREGGETHFWIEIVADSFAGKSRIERQRTVYGLLAEELKERVHALQLTTLAPGEAGSR
jgi:BolA protein